MDNRFGRRVRMLRKMLGMHQAQLAEMVGVTPEFLSRIERGVSTPSFKLIYSLATALETDPANLFLPVSDKVVTANGMDGGHLGAVGLMSRLGSWEQNLITGEFHCSDSFYLIYGYRPREVPATRKTFRKHTHPEDLEKTETTWQAIFAGQAVYNVVFRIIRKDGVERTLIATCEVEFDQDGTPVRVFGSLADITESLHFDQFVETQHATLEERVREQTNDLQLINERLEQEVQKRRQTEEDIRFLFEKTAGVTGQEYFDCLVSLLCEWLGVDLALVGVLGQAGDRVEAQAMYRDGEQVQNFSYPLVGSPCETVFEKGVCVFEENTRKLYPEDKGLQRFGAEAYIGVPLTNSRGCRVGILSVVSRRKMRIPDWRVQVIGSIADRTAAEIERLQAEKALRESEEKFRSFYEQAGEGILLGDSKSNILHANPMALTMLGYTLQEMTTFNAADLLHPDDLLQILPGKVVKQAQEDGATRVVRFYRCKNGEYLPVQVTLTIIKGSGLHHVMFSDISERKEAEAIRKDFERLFLHDIRTPLSAILKIPGLLRSEANFTLDQEELLTVMEDACYKMMGLLKVSLELHKLEKGDYRVSGDRFDLILLIRRMVRILGLLTRGRKVRTVVSLDKCPVMGSDVFNVHGDEVLCFSMFSNLIKNAIEATPSGSTVYIDLARQGGCVIISIHNDGAVSGDVRDHFFDKYVTAGKPQGMGLGTYSAMLIAKAHGGGIEMDTSEEEGTTVTVRLSENPA